ncbi:MAG: helix-turn-helix domain-containing protein [Spirochaetaceae bacterium]|nr:helix-turn-helix domain-containing protein [Spirochaetaceae bacterium]
MKNGQELQKVLGTNIKIKRKRMCLSQEKLGEIVDVSRNCISDLEAGNNFIGSEVLARLANALETEVYELFKTDDVLPDKATDVLLKYCEEIKKIAEKTKKDYLRKMK